MTKKILLFTSILFLFVNAFSQEIDFQSKEYDFGIIKEKDGPQKGRFIFANIGDDTLKITSVRSSCGCTVADYSKEPILPGKQGFIDAVYNPLGRPGKFGKALSVFSNCKINPSLSLTIRGDVIPRPKTKADEYPFDIGNLSFKINNISFNDVRNSQLKTDTVWMYNKGNKSINIEFKELPSFIRISQEPSVIKPKTEAFFIITYDGRTRNDWGFLLDKIFIETNDEFIPKKQLTLSANLIEDFSMLTKKQLAKLPVLSLDTNNFNFGKVKTGEIVKGNFNIKNTGKDKLIIRKITSSNDNLIFSVSNTQIKKNAVAKINFVFDTKGKPTRHHKTLAVITNDPQNTIIVLHIQGSTE